MSDLQGISLAVVGGDKRDQILIQRLIELGAKINVIGLPVDDCEQISIKNHLSHALTNAAALLLPMPGIDPQGKVYAPLYDKKLYLNDEELQTLPTGAPIFVGVARPKLRQMAEKRGAPIIEVAEMDEFAILNSVPSAEGAIQMAMEGLPITIHGSHSVIIGFGRLAVTLTRMLMGLGSKVTVVARDPVARARVWEMGAQPLPLERLTEALAQGDFIYNTVPFMVLDQEKIEAMNPEGMIIDLATAPGGTDFEAARQKGVKAELAPGLPGKVAAKTAGMLVARVYPGLIRKHLLGTDR
ncbi:dipicolinate synthase subunit DpsA [Heliorestis convoluta]|uniref:Dipicolinate synthase subunit DpsA n=1 Tax=Heliorestis convoluta TaxID=356322 RepID=A0A5Q2MZ34_9FIRM|nr:dipicolinate synthase subunit DpsA [Heliorestis convoluta]QGG48234.1 dipicolinate synthase subunit DpsA [Heliorestis convoluta]